MSRGLYRIREKAVEDLEKIWMYTFENWSLEQADRYYDLMIAEIEYIADHFYSGKPMDHVKEGYRASKIKSHIIFYKAGPDNMVDVVRILHQRIDVKNRLKD